MILHGVITIFLGTIVALMLTADVGDFKSATFAKTLKEKEFEIQKMAFKRVEQDSTIEQLKLTQELLNAKIVSINITKDSIDTIVSPSFEAIIWDFTDAVAERKLTQAVANC